MLHKKLSANLFVRLVRGIRFYFFLRRHSEYTIVHIHMSTPSSAIEYVMAAKRLRRKIVTHAHAGGDYRRGALRKFIYAVCRNFLWKMADCPLACSEMAAEWLYSERHREKIRIVYNGIDLERFIYNASVRRNVRMRYHLQNTCVIGHIGRFAPEKNHIFLIQMVQEIKKSIPVKLMLVGDGAEMEHIKNLVCQNDLEHEVIFAGESHIVPDLLQAMDIFVLPSLYEGLGIAALEAQASGLPCVLSTGVPREVKCTQNCSFLSLNGQIESWIDKIMELRKNTNRELTASEKRNMKRFDIRNTTDIITDIYLGA